MPADPNDLAARRARWQRIYEAMPEPARIAHDREKARRRQLRETRLRAVIDKAISEALPAVLSKAFAEAAPESPITESDAAPAAAPAPPAVETPLHQLSEESWYEQRLAYWTQHLPRTSAPMTIGDLIGGGPGDDGGA